MPRPLKIALIGYGKMGHAIERLALAAGHDVVLRISSQDVDDCTPDLLRHADVAIEFTQPEAAFDNIARCLAAGLPVVSGTTGWLDRLPELHQRVAETDGAFLYASNFSIGVNLFFALNRHLASLMDGQPQYEVAIEEIHHAQKKDAPSGTAISLAEDLIARIGRKNAWALVGNAPIGEGQIGIVAQREGEAPGTHHIRYDSPIDRIEISHTSHSREGFARGALLAAEWLPGKKGVFGMGDLLGF